MLFVASAEAQFLVWWIWYLLSFLLWIHFTEKDLLCTAALPDDSIVMTSKKSKFFRKNYFKFSWILKNDSKRHLSVQIDTIRLFFFSLFARPSHSNSTFFLFHMIFKCQILSSRNLWKKDEKLTKTPKKVLSAELLHLAKLLVCYCSIHQKRLI